MATYFDSTVQADKDLLPFAARSNADLAKIAARVEKEVIGEYTQRAHYLLYTAREGSGEGAPELINSSLGIYVYLRGYKVNAADAATDAGLKDALKNEIADVIAWRIQRGDVNTLTTSEADGSGMSKSIHPNAVNLFPPGFGRWLRPYDIREPLWAV
jgi:hypothetical protein